MNAAGEREGRISSFRAGWKRAREPKNNPPPGVRVGALLLDQNRGIGVPRLVEKRGYGVPRNGEK